MKAIRLTELQRLIIDLNIKNEKEMSNPTPEPKKETEPPPPSSAINIDERGNISYMGVSGSNISTVADDIIKKAVREMGKEHGLNVGNKTQLQDLKETIIGIYNMLGKKLPSMSSNQKKETQFQLKIFLLQHHILRRYDKIIKEENEMKKIINLLSEEEIDELNDKIGRY
jgi:hypothetical protein